MPKDKKEYRILTVGDLHLSDKFKGRHKNYWDNCLSVMDMITKSIEDNGITHVIQLGDWIGIGLAEKNLKRRESLLTVMQYLQKWNRLTNGNVYSLRGNHDIGPNLTDFELFVSIGLIKTTKTLDIGSARLHLFDYGEENRQIEVKEDSYNIGFFHENLMVQGETDWYRGGDGVELSGLKNLEGISLAISGHIHPPSPKIITTSIGQTDVNLIYPGNPTRPKKDPNLWDYTYGVIITTEEEGNTSVSQIEYELVPNEELFVKTFEDAEVDDSQNAPAINIDELRAILEELQSYQIGGSMDYESQIRRVASLDTTAADIAIEYLRQAESEFIETN